jgi:flagellar basal-body rod modification protein FlgD
MEVNRAAAASTTTTPTVTPGAVPSAEEGRHTFLRLLVAQLEHQDPIKPMENAEFTAQLAQFSALEQMETMNANFEALLSNQEANSRIQAVGYIGKTVQANGNTIEVHQGAAAPLRYTLGGSSAQVSINIVNADGEVVRTLNEGAQSAGLQTVPWPSQDGLNSLLPDGTYHFTVTASDPLGNPVAVETSMQGVVEGIEYVDNRPFLVIGDSRIDLSSVVSVHET